MKNYSEFKGYRTRTVYDPASKSFCARKAPDPVFGCSSPSDRTLPEGWRVYLDLSIDDLAALPERSVPKRKTAAARRQPEHACS